MSENERAMTEGSRTCTQPRDPLITVRLAESDLMMLESAARTGVHYMGYQREDDE